MEFHQKRVDDNREKKHVFATRKTELFSNTYNNNKSNKPTTNQPQPLCLMCRRVKWKTERWHDGNNWDHGRKVRSCAALAFHICIICSNDFFSFWLVVACCPFVFGKPQILFYYFFFHRLHSPVNISYIEMYMGISTTDDDNVDIAVSAESTRATQCTLCETAGFATRRSSTSFGRMKLKMKKKKERKKWAYDTIHCGEWAQERNWKKNIILTFLDVMQSSAQQWACVRVHYI